MFTFPINEELFCTFSLDVVKLLVILRSEKVKTPSVNLIWNVSRYKLLPLRYRFLNLDDFF